MWFQAAARYVHSTLRNSSTTISNIIGPVEQMALDNHPVKGLYFMVVGPPEVYHCLHSIFFILNDYSQHLLLFIIILIRKT